MEQFKAEVLYLLGYISKEQVYGIDLDIIVHFSVGMIITVFLLKFNRTNMFIILTLLILTILKELFDAQVMTYRMIDSIYDAFANYSFFLIYKIFGLFSNRSSS